MEARPSTSTWWNTRARLECGTALAITEFGPSYRRATVMQASLAALGLVAAVGAWLEGPGTHEWQVWRSHLHLFAQDIFRE